MKRIAITILALVGLYGRTGHCAPIQPVVVTPSILVSSVAASGGQAMVTISTPTAASANSSGYYNYITNIHIEYYAVSTLTGGATPVTCTTSNLPSNPVFKLPTAEATGTDAITDIVFTNPLQATQASQVTVTCPQTTNVIWNVVVGYFVSN